MPCTARRSEFSRGIGAEYLRELMDIDPFWSYHEEKPALAPQLRR